MTITKRWEDNRCFEYEVASEFTKYHQSLSKKIISILKKDGFYKKQKSTLLDIGCGTGNFDRILAGDFKDITGIDIDKTPLHFFEEKIKSDDIKNIKLIKGDWKGLLKKEQQYDYLLLSLFGHPKNDNVKLIFSKIKNGIFIITNTYDKSKEINSKELNERLRKRSNKTLWEKYLDDSNFDYTLEKISINFGQPFFEAAEAENFLRSYYEPKVVKEKIKTLVKIDDLFLREHNFNNKLGFKYYLPNHKNISLIYIKL